MIDCQIHSAHLESLGAMTVSRETFTELLDQHCEKIGRPGLWNTETLSTQASTQGSTPSDEH